REDQDLLASGVFLVQELNGLQQTAGDVRVGRGARAVDEVLDVAGEGALLLVGDARPVVEGRLGDDVALGKTACIDARDRQRVLRLQARQREQNDLLRLIHLTV